MKQFFAKGYSEGNAAEASFPEYVERPIAAADGSVNITFSQTAGRGFYDQIEDAIAAGDEEPIVDFSAIPAGWTVPEVKSM